jgi:hypothetical protein
VHLADSSFEIDALVNMEHTVLRMLDFKISVHTSYYFASRLKMAGSMTDKEHSFMVFLLGTPSVDCYIILPQCSVNDGARCMLCQFM